ncbi:putative undecaprenyl pyrophosphate protein [Calycina marina]|uniref:tRNA (guanine(37)-N1)-methyltransferase n=1 Tax=Calycina marina TaxID=1763456 RepID=A0A9P8CHJ6_9HELO|nr:putative undecaprenyl pyrophosphate protein [Calycina marina]
MAVAAQATDIFRQDAKSQHSAVTPAERERLLAIEEPTSYSRLGVRTFFRNQLYALVFAIIHTLFSVYIRFRQAYHAVKDRVLAILYYHHRTPELIQKDVKGLSRLPEHLSVILRLEDGAKGGAGLETLADEIAEIAAWCACVGIPVLSIYEQSGMIKQHLPTTHRTVMRKLSSYFGPQTPALTFRAPHVPSIESESPASTEGLAVQRISILLLSEEDGKDSIVDLTKTLAEMSQRLKISSNDISIELVNAEISENVMSDPDLLILFTPTVELAGYPPWQLRLTEIFHVEDNHGVGYQVFLRALSCSTEAMSIFRPSIVRTSGAALDRAIFNKTIPVAAARVFEPKNINKYVKALQSSRDIVGLDRLKPTILDPDSSYARKGGKCILLRPQIKPEGISNPSTWGKPVLEGVAAKEIEVLAHEVKLDYDYYSYAEVMQALLPEDMLDEIPSGFAVVGHVAHLNIRDQYLPYKHIIAEVVKDKNPSIKTVINKIDTVGEQSEFRTFDYEVLLGEDNMNVEVIEGGCTFEFDFSKVYWNPRLETEHKRLIGIFKPGEVVCDVMAGIGPFALPAAKKGVLVFANDLNPESFQYLQKGIIRNKVEKFVRPYKQDGHHFIGYTVNELIHLNVVDANIIEIPAKRKFGASESTGGANPQPPTLITIPKTVNHFVMNLPASAIEFLHAFCGVYRGHENLFKPHTNARLPLVHVHCFSTKSADNAREAIDICQRISKQLEYEIKGATSFQCQVTTIIRTQVLQNYPALK